jgi:hypothetical protein
LNRVPGVSGASDRYLSAGPGDVPEAAAAAAALFFEYFRTKKTMTTSSRIPAKEPPAAKTQILRSLHGVSIMFPVKKSKKKEMS